MINLRYHIVSITAVFLALGIGLTLGSTFLDRVTVDTLKAQLDDVEAQVARTEQESSELRSELDALRARNEALQEALPERLLSGRLDGVPVLVIASRGTAPELHGEALGALGSAGADVAGTWWLTDRWALDDDEEVSELADVLGVATEDPDRLRRNAAIQLAELLNEAAAPAEEADPTAEAPTDPGAGQAGDSTAGDAPAGEPGAVGEAGDQAAPLEPSEPALVAALRDAGFIEYETLDRASEEVGVLLPPSGARYVVLSSAQDADGPQAFATALVDEVAAEAPVPVVAAQGEVEMGSDEDPLAEDDRRTSFVGSIRQGELTQDRVSTIDHLDTAAGIAALVLAVEDLAEPTIGHYGVAADAARLLPGPPTEP